MPKFGFFGLLLFANIFSANSAIALPKSQSATREERKQAAEACRWSNRASFREVQSCGENFLQISSQEREFNDVKTKAGNSTAAALPSGVNADAGAQCAVAGVMQQGLVNSRRVLESAADIQRQNGNVRVNVMTAIAEAERAARILPRLEPCLRCVEANSRQRNRTACEETCSYRRQIETAIVDMADSNAIPRASAQIPALQQRIEAIVTEQKALLQKSRDLHTAIQADITQRSAAVRELMNQRTEIHRQYRCTSENTPTALADPIRDRREATPLSTGSVSSTSTATATDDGRLELNARTGAPPPSSKENEIERATRLVTNQDGKAVGTGFYVRTVGPDGQERYEFVTAHHVPETQRDWGTARDRYANSYDANHTPAMTNPVRNGQIYSGEGASMSHQFEVEPGNYDHGNDVMKTRAPPGAALGVAREGDLPTVGQEFVLAGHPGLQNDITYTNRRCSFVGYAPSLYGTDMNYLMDCPTNTAHQGGMSGGPMVNPSTGQVYGVVSAHALNGNNIDVQRMIVSPIYQDTNGAVRVGPQPQVVVRNCFRTGGSSEQPHSCSIIPGAQFSTQ